MPEHDILEVLGGLADERGGKTLVRRLKRLIPKLSGKVADRLQLKKLFKANIHDHIDCSVRYETMLDLWDQLYGFDFEKVVFPEWVIRYWEAVDFDPSDVAFPREIVDSWRCEHIDIRHCGVRKAAQVRRKSRQHAVELYRKFLIWYGSGSLFHYVQAIVVHVLPLMQSAANIDRIIKERIQDGKELNGEGMAELRGAPQLHTWSELDMEAATRAYVSAIGAASYPIRLALCALRHEDPKVAWNVAKFAGKYRQQGVSCFDLAADEASNPGVLDWWVKPAVLAALFGVELTIHLWETNEPTPQDVMLLNAFDWIVPSARRRLALAGLKVEQVLESSEKEEAIALIIDEAIAEILARSERDRRVEVPHLIKRLGHGFRGSQQGTRICEVSFSSNLVTKQVASIAAHPAHDLFHKQRAQIAICTDGTTLIGITGLVDEMALLQDYGWDVADFLVANVVAVVGSSFTSKEKMLLLRRCASSYELLAPRLSRRSKRSALRNQ